MVASRKLRQDSIQVLFTCEMAVSNCLQST